MSSPYRQILNAVRLAFPQPVSDPIGVDTFAIKRQEFDDPAYRDTLPAHNEYNRNILWCRVPTTRRR